MLNSKLTKRIGLQFFAEDTNEPDTSNDGSGGASGTEPPNYEELLKTDKSFQSFLESKITKATATAIETYKNKEKIKADQTLSEAEKLKGMTDSEKVEYFRAKAESLEQAHAKSLETESLKSQTIEILKEKKIPVELAEHLFDFSNATADDIKKRVDKLSEYEFHKAGEFDAELKRQLDEKLKQKPPYTSSTGGANDDSLLKAFGLM